MGRKQKLVFPDRLPATLVHLRLGLPHTALAELFDVDRSTISTAIREVRPLRPQDNPPQDEYRTGARPHDGLLIT